MKYIKLKTLVLAFLLIYHFSSGSDVLEPTELIGNWESIEFEDSKAAKGLNTIEFQFNKDLTFSCKGTYDSGKIESYSGTYVIKDSVIEFTFPKLSKQVVEYTIIESILTLNDEKKRELGKI